MEEQDLMAELAAQCYGYEHAEAFAKRERKNPLLIYFGEPCIETPNFKANQFMAFVDGFAQRRAEIAAIRTLFN
jgi:hypothetical protein